MQRLFRSALVASAFLACVPIARAGTLDGRWDASIKADGVEIPFRIDLSGDGKDFKATLFNGDVEVRSTSGRLEDGAVVAKFEHFLGTLEAKPKGDELSGTYRHSAREFSKDYEFHARRHAAEPATTAEAPSIAGLWEIPVESPKGEKAWRFIVRQDGAKVRASILRVDGDTGELDGTYRDGKFVLSHFDGARALRAEVTREQDGTLKLVVQGPFSNYGTKNGGHVLTAIRPADARSKGLPEPADFARHTTVKDANEAFRFSFPDVDGQTLSNDSPRFKGKVVVAVVTGTWCPNCHDEAQYLVELDRKYRDRGLEIVALDFEEPEQQDDLARVRSFIKQYGVKYTYLIAGAPVEMWEKVPQAVNLNSWPTTFFVGRDGRVKKIHSGFAAPASGEFNDQLKKDFTSTIEALLAENASASR